ncbi:MAG: hypothetical protein ACRCTP_02445 [Aeromonas popoffii]|uniref:hypothetical protein n=1 Tax=Aeromonas popoffii TaxID=70856 RepID=UPI003F36BA99
MSEKQQADQYYTPDGLAADYTKLFLEFIGNEPGEIIEPSAGTGAFIRGLLSNGVAADRILAYDLEPKCNDFLVTTANFYQVTDVNPRFAIGNPPFGKGGSEAIKFMNHCAELGVRKLGFINPSCVGNKFFTDSQLLRGWKPISTKEHWFPSDAHFVLDNNEQYGEKENPVNCIFQLWEYDPKYQRPYPPTATECGDFRILKQPLNKEVIGGKQREIPVGEIDADLVFVTHGKNAGRILPFEAGIHKANVKCFLKIKTDIELVKAKLGEVDWELMKQFSTIRHNPSLSPAEIIDLYETKHNAD